MEKEKKVSALNRIQQGLKAPKKEVKGVNFKSRSAEDILEEVKPLLETSTITLSDEIVVFGSHEPQIVTVTKEVSAWVNGQKVSKTENIHELVGGERFYIKATATLKDGDEIWSTVAYARENLDKKGLDASQLTGMASSYARKYALQGLFALDDTKDADHIEDIPTKAQSGSGSGWQHAKQVPLDEAERKFNQSLSSPMYGQTNGEPPF